MTYRESFFELRRDVEELEARVKRIESRGKCGTCKHWVNPEDSWNNVRLKPKLGHCERILEESKNKDPQPKAIVIGYDDSGTILCSADFGCALWESA